MSDIKAGVFKPRICKEPNCNNPLCKENKSGFCNSCYGKLYRVPKMLKRRRELKRIREDQ